MIVQSFDFIFIFAFGRQLLRVDLSGSSISIPIHMDKKSERYLCVLCCYIKKQ